MKQFKIYTDSTCDLNKTYLTQNKITILPIEIELDGKRYLTYPDNRELPISLLNKKLLENKKYKTSPIFPSNYINQITKDIQNNYDILIVTPSKHISATYISALATKDALTKQYPSTKILVLDSYAVSSSLNTTIKQIITIQQTKNLDIKQTYDYITNNKPKLKQYFIITNPQYLKTNDRYNIKQLTKPHFFPKLHLLSYNNTDNTNTNNKQIKIEATTTNKETLNLILFDKIQKDLDKLINNNKKITISISHAMCEMDAINIANKIKSHYNKQIDIEINTMSLPVNLYLGPYSLSISYYGKE